MSSGSEILKLEGDSLKHVEIVETEKQESAPVYLENTEEEKRLLRKIDLHLMPVIFLLYLFSYMDRTNIGNARIAGMDKDLGLSSNQYSLAVVMFQISYVLGQVPSNMVLPRVRPSLYIPVLMFLWGTATACIGAVQTRQQLYALRFILGIFEAGYIPAVLFIISTWYRKQEQSKRFICFLSAGVLSGAFGGVIAGAVAASLDGAHGMPGWRWLFIVEGVTTASVAFFTPLVLLDYPATTKRFTQAERDLAHNRIRADGITSHAEGEKAYSPVKALLQAISTWRIWILTLAYTSIMGSLSLSYFFPTLVKGLGYSAISAQFMTAPLYIVAVFIAVPICIWADMKPILRLPLDAVVLALGALFCFLCAGITAYVPRYIFLCLINSAIWTANPLSLSFASSSLAPVRPEVRAISMAMITSGGNLAQIYGSYVLPLKDAPKYTMGFSVFASLLLFGAIVYTIAFFLFRRSPYTGRN